MFIAISAMIVALWTLIPFFWMYYASFMTEPEVQRGIFRAVEEPTLDNYLRIFGLSETEALFGGQTKAIAADIGLDIKYVELVAPLVAAGIIVTALFFVKSIHDKRRIDKTIENETN